MAKRSPILGFNHNFRHRGLVFHVQTEDSGVENPHIFTHLFNGGVILSSRKLTYDAGSAEEVIKALMQAQHKAMLKDLRKGLFDNKIDEYFGDLPELEPRAADTQLEMPRATDTAPSARAPTPTELEELELGEEDIEVVGSPADTLRDGPPAAVTWERSAPVVIEAQDPAESDAVPQQRPGAYAKHRTGSFEHVEETGARRRPRPETAEKIRAPRTSSPPRLPPKAVEIAADIEAAPAKPEPEVVTSRPSVIVGAPPKVVGKKEAPPRAREGTASLFGKDLISEKSLDEVILAYLSEDGSSQNGSS